MVVTMGRDDGKSDPQESADKILIEFAINFNDQDDLVKISDIVHSKVSGVPGSHAVITWQH